MKKIWRCAIAVDRCDYDTLPRGAIYIILRVLIYTHAYIHMYVVAYTATHETNMNLTLIVQISERQKAMQKDNDINVMQLFEKMLNAMYRKSRIITQRLFK